MKKINYEWDFICGGREERRYDYEGMRGMITIYFRDEIKSEREEEGRKERK